MLDSLLDGYTRSILIFTGIHIMAAYSFYVPFKTGQVSLGQAGFMAVGAYASGILTVKFGLPFPVALLIGGLITGNHRHRRRIPGVAHQGHLPAAAHPGLRRDRQRHYPCRGNIRAARRVFRASPTTSTPWNTCMEFSCC